MDALSQDLLGTQWRAAAQALGIEATVPYVFTLPSGTAFTFAALLPQFGGPRGMLLSTHFDRSAFDAAKAAGFGISTMYAETTPQHLGEIESYMECLRDWGWAATEGLQPRWYNRNSQNAV